MFKKNISQKEILIAVVIYLISVPFVFQLLEKQYKSFGLIKGSVEGFTGPCERTCKKIQNKWAKKQCLTTCGLL